MDDPEIGELLLIPKGFFTHFFAQNVVIPKHFLSSYMQLPISICMDGNPSYGSYLVDDKQYILGSKLVGYPAGICI